MSGDAYFAARTSWPCELHERAKRKADTSPTRGDAHPVLPCPAPCAPMQVSHILSGVDGA